MYALITIHIVSDTKTIAVTDPTIAHISEIVKATLLLYTFSVQYFCIN